MPSGSAELENELKILRRGRGLYAPMLAEQVGPRLRELCGIGGTENSAEIRERLTDRLRILISGLPRDLQQAVNVALALHSDTQQQFLQDRIQFLADLQTRDVRTIRRRMDEGFHLLAEKATQPAPAVPRDTGLGWHIGRLEAVLRMDKTSPECFTRRTIVAERNGLDRVQDMITVPKGDHRPADRHDLDAELYFGATLLSVERTASNRFAFELGLPEPLSVGQRHEYGMVMRIPDEQPMRNHYVFFPNRECEEFQLRVRFAQDRRPALIWRMSDAFPRDVDDDSPTETLLMLDGAGEVNLTFRQLRPGHGYGVQWRPV
ncbi:MAG TPA: hypothetical protein VFW65_10650 [Pseudonocardiaceae bacterium]|nr:hypothetical protein [Pseudonocardiaceae bacterium]